MKRRRRRSSGVARFNRLTVQDRFVLRFWHRYGVLIPGKGIAIRNDEELQEQLDVLPSLHEVFEDEPEPDAKRVDEMARWKREGYLTRRKDKVDVDGVTKSAIRYPVDRLAIQKGCRFDTARGLFAIEWMEHNLVLYEGDMAGDPFTCHDWQDEVTRRLFGWVSWSEKWERWVRRFRYVIVFIAKKNKKSPTLAAWSCYTAFGDGEPGNHVHLCAKDGQQARKVAGRHTIEMLLRSPTLVPELKINQNEMEVTHLPTRSTIIPLSSANSRTTKAKEGLNGSYFIDESHVVDWDFVAILKRMGISRPEPLGGDLSTAGNNPDGYGKDRCDYGRKVNECKHVQDIRTCAAVYEAPQKLTAADLEADPVKYGKMANPAWGHTIDEEEFLADFETSRDSVKETRDFAMYRLNIWQRAANPWLNIEKWDACRAEYTIRDLAGRPCGGGWDLMRSRDMAALAFAFPEEEAGSLEARADIPYRSLVYFWMPESAIEEYSSELPMLLQWADDGWLRKVDGETLNYRQVEDETAELISLFDVQRFNYDPMFAEASAQQLVQSHGYPEERLATFPQTTKYYSYPIAVFEKLLTAEKMHHNGNPVTDWQAGHVCVNEKDGKRTLTKPEGAAWKKIDGIAALVMAFDAALRRDPTAGISVYNTRGLRSI